MMNLLLKPTPQGERAFPVEAALLKEMAARGEIEKISDRPVAYRIKPVVKADAQAPEDLDSIPDEDPIPQVYTTRDMVAKPGTRRRTRAPKNTLVR
jgi:hypothetical protein